MHLEKGRVVSDDDAIVYTPGALPEYKGNPLIEALPPIRSDEEVLRGLFRLPELDPDERTLNNVLRKKCIDRLDQIVCPTPSYLAFHRIVEDSLLSAYQSKNPFSATPAYWLHYLDNQDCGIHPSSGPFRSRARVATVIGESGVGKSTMIKSVLRQYPQVIQHKAYQGANLPLTQLVYLYVECPSSASIRALCKAILKGIDDVLGTSYADVPRQHSIAAYEDDVEQAIRNTFLGVIVIDEFQNVSVQRGGGLKSLVAFLLRLVNASGVPFVSSGTPDILDVVGKSLRMSRRFESGGVVSVRQLDKDLWQLFVERLWEYQWTRNITPLRKDLSDELYRQSRGIHDFAVRTFAQTQKDAIDSGSETLTPGGIREGFRRAAEISRDQLNSLGKIEATPHNAQTKSPTSIRQDDAEAADQTKDTRRVPDIDQIQHPELEPRILSAVTSGISLPDGYDQELLTSQFNSKEILKNLEESGLVVTDPLNFPSGPLAEQ